MIPAHLYAKLSYACLDGVEANVARREIEFLVIGRVVGNVHLAISACDAAIDIEDDRRVMIETWGTTFEETRDEHDVVLSCFLRIELCCIAWNGLGIAEVHHIFRLAEVRAVVQFLKNDELCTFLG